MDKRGTLPNNVNKKSSVNTAKNQDTWPHNVLKLLHPEWENLLVIIVRSKAISPETVPTPVKRGNKDTETMTTIAKFNVTNAMVLGTNLSIVQINEFMNATITWFYVSWNFENLQYLSYFSFLFFFFLFFLCFFLCFFCLCLFLHLCSLHLFFSLFVLCICVDFNFPKPKTHRKLISLHR